MFAGRRELRFTFHYIKHIFPNQKSYVTQVLVSKDTVISQLLDVSLPIDQTN